MPIGAGNEFRTDVEHIFLHKDSYLGGEYETVGGYDLILLKVFKDKGHLKGHKKLFLPGKYFP